MKQKLIKARKDKQLTQKQLGELVGLSNKAISSIECGRTQGTIATWDALEKILGIPQQILRKTNININN